jgi:GntR family transcriptional regulator
VTAAPPTSAGPATPATPATVQTLLAMTPPRFSGSLPLWYQLAQSLRTAILSLGQDGPTRLPTEVEFARHYGVSLTTVRQALGSLAADGLITRQSSEEVRVLGRDQVAAGAVPAARLGITGHAVLIRRLRLDGGEPVSYAENYLRPEHAARISDADLAAAPVTKILRDALALPLTRIDNEVSACTAPAELAALLRVDVLSPVLRSENVTYAAGGTPVDVARIHYRGDRFTFAISLDIP